MKKKSLAVVGVGIIGGGVFGQGIPAMVKGLIKLQEIYDITIYSFVPINKSEAPSGIG